MRSILVVNPKGGCGKTTIATNLASYYAVWGVPTALVDLDPQQSSMDWLKARPDQYSTIYGTSGLSGRIDLPSNVKRVIYDVPARSLMDKTLELLRQSHAVVIPVMPSPIDIRAAAGFLGELLVKGRLRQSNRLVGIVANRVRENTLIYHTLEKFLKGVEIPFVTTLRDSQNYVRAAQRGVGIFDMGPAAVEQDLKQWKPLINWVEGKHVRTR